MASAQKIKLKYTIEKNSISLGVTLHLMNLLTILNSFRWEIKFTAFCLVGRLSHTDPDQREIVYNLVMNNELYQL